MRKSLTCSTALVATMTLAGEAPAADGLKLGITGFYRNSIGSSFGSAPTTQHFGTGPLGTAGITTSGLGNFDRQAVSMRQEIRVNFTGETTLEMALPSGFWSGSTERTSPSLAATSSSIAHMAISKANSAKCGSVRMMVL